MNDTFPSVTDNTLELK